MAYKELCLYATDQEIINVFVEFEKQYPIDIICNHINTIDNTNCPKLISKKQYAFSYETPNPTKQEQLLRTIFQRYSSFAEMKTLNLYDEISKCKTDESVRIDLYYKIVLKGDSLYIRERTFSDGQTVYSLNQKDKDSIRMCFYYFHHRPTAETIYPPSPHRFVIWQTNSNKEKSLEIYQLLKDIFGRSFYKHGKIYYSQKDKIPNSGWTKGDLSVRAIEQKIYEEIQQEEFEQVTPKVFKKKEKLEITDPNKACYESIAIWVYGYNEYSERIGFVTDINYVCPRFHTSMLHEAISCNCKVEIALDLIHRGIDVDIQDWNGNTALHYLVSHSLKDPQIRIITNALLNQHPDVNILNNKGISVLWSTVHRSGPKPEKEIFDIIQLLLSMGADKQVLPKSFQEWLDEILNLKF